MYRSESVINNLLMEIDSLSNRIKNIRLSYCNTGHYGLRERLFNEKKNISERLKEIYSIAKILQNRKNEKISFSNFLLEKCERTIAQVRIEKNLFFL